MTICRFFGFEHYNVFTLDFYALSLQRRYSYDFSLRRVYQDFIIPFDNIEHVTRNEKWHWQELEEIPNNKELIKSAKKLYFYPKCSISRSLVATKYKICKNMAEADAIIVPDGLNYNISSQVSAIFTNEKSKTIVLIDTPSWNMEDKGNDEFKSIFENMPEGFLFKNIARINNVSMPDYVIDCLEFLCVKELANFYKSYNHLEDYVTGMLPLEKIVYEKEVQKQLVNENNEITLEALKSIHDMLESSDNLTRSAGLKALSTMNYMDYVNSVKLVLRYSGNKISDYSTVKARNSVPVKFMLRYLDNPHKRYNYDEDITMKDYLMFRDLYAHIYKVENEKLNNQIKYLNFMTISPDGALVPKLKRE